MSKGTLNAPGNPSGEAGDDTQETLSAPAQPLFDAPSVRRARAIEPLPAGRARRARTSPALRLLMVLVAAGLIGAAAGGLTIALYRGSRQAASPAPHAEANLNAEDASPAMPPERKDDAVVDSAGARNAGDAAGEEVSDAGRAASSPGAADEGGERAALRGALDEWLEATNRRDIDGQMSFYGERLSSYYLARNASRAAVRAEKSRVFGAARGVSVSAGEPEIVLGAGGREATMRFRKRYAIEAGGGASRRGEVLQELRWRRDEAGNWRIVGERDLRVID